MAEAAKYRFSFQQRFAVWKMHEERCWICGAPVRFLEVTIDHVIPEALLHDPVRLHAVLHEHGLPDTFPLNSYANWLPAHNFCNQKKGARTFRYVPGNLLILERLHRLAPQAERLAERIERDAVKDRLYGMIAVAIEKGEFTWEDLRALFPELPQPPNRIASLQDLIQLDNGYWLHRSDVAREGYCQCERERCVGAADRVYCYFSAALSPWVIQKGLYWRCYDEEVLCPRCQRRHRRGHIGRFGTCAAPYADQVRQADVIPGNDA